ncbi:MAG TPA: hypothetical protein VG708_00045, partial [Mycobacteriales bacterium]|nr:hypothetical protein [Mycobacteriales bacterium]
MTAVSDSAWEAELAAGLEAASGVDLVRRCVDLADLLAVATAGVGRGAVVSGDLRGLDGDAVARLRAAGVAVVGVAAADSATGARLRRLGVTEVLGRDAVADDVVAALAVALRATTDPASQRAWAHAASSASVPAPAEPMPAGDPGGSAGTVIAVWGPAGAPGRSVTALNLAAELADIGGSSLLVDADPYGGTAGQLLGLLDEAPGLAAACRQANQGALDAAGLAGLTVELRPRFRVLTGITRSARWLELRPSALDAVLTVARCLADHVVVDVGFCLEQDEEL